MCIHTLKYSSVRIHIFTTVALVVYELNNILTILRLEAVSDFQAPPALVVLDPPLENYQFSKIHKKSVTRKKSSVWCFSSPLVRFLQSPVLEFPKNCTQKRLFSSKS